MTVKLRQRPSDEKSSVKELKYMITNSMGGGSVAFLVVLLPKINYEPINLTEVLCRVFYRAYFAERVLKSNLYGRDPKNSVMVSQTRKSVQLFKKRSFQNAFVTCITEKGILKIKKQDIYVFPYTLKSRTT